MGPKRKFEVFQKITSNFFRSLWKIVPSLLKSVQQNYLVSLCSVEMATKILHKSTWPLFASRVYGNKRSLKLRHFTLFRIRYKGFDLNFNISYFTGKRSLQFFTSYFFDVNSSSNLRATPDALRWTPRRSYVPKRRWWWFSKRYLSQLWIHRKYCLSFLSRACLAGCNVDDSWSNVTHFHFRHSWLPRIKTVKAKTSLNTQCS